MMMDLTIQEDVQVIAMVCFLIGDAINFMIHIIDIITLLVPLNVEMDMCFMKLEKVVMIRTEVGAHLIAEVLNLDLIAL